jgi:hypothetical protein
MHRRRLADGGVLFTPAAPGLFIPSSRSRDTKGRIRGRSSVTPLIYREPGLKPHGQNVRAFLSCVRIESASGTVTNARAARGRRDGPQRLSSQMEPDEQAVLIIDQAAGTDIAATGDSRQYHRAAAAAVEAITHNETVCRWDYVTYERRTARHCRAGGCVRQRARRLHSCCGLGRDLHCLRRMMRCGGVACTTRVAAAERRCRSQRARMPSPGPPHGRGEIHDRSAIGADRRGCTNGAGAIPSCSRDMWSAQMWRTAFAPAPGPILRNLRATYTCAGDLRAQTSIVSCMQFRDTGPSLRGRCKGKTFRQHAQWWRTRFIAERPRLIVRPSAASRMSGRSGDPPDAGK